MFRLGGQVKDVFEKALEVVRGDYSMVTADLLERTIAEMEAAKEIDLNRLARSESIPLGKIRVYIPCA